VIDGILFANAGSVGRPKDGDWRACYLLLHLSSDSGGTAMTPELVRVEYDLTKAREGILSSALPNEFAEVLSG